MDGLQFAILSCVGKFGVERTTSATYHLLKGRKSAQTQQDAKLYKLEKWFRLFPMLKREEYEKQLHHLQEINWIQSSGEQSVLLTNLGKEVLSQAIFPPVNGWSYGEGAEIFWQRLVLLVQTVSNLQAEEKHFRPIVTDMGVTTWVKYFLTKSIYTRKELAEALYRELHTFLQTCEESLPTIFVGKLTSAKRVGQTEKQIGEKLGISPWTVTYFFLSALHKLAQTSYQYPILQKIIPTLPKNKVSHSAKKTAQLLSQGWTIAQISQSRGLRENTIEDHIVEIVRNNPSLSIDYFVPKKMQKQIKSVYQERKSGQLRELKEHLPEEYTYFQIRLVLTKMAGGE